MKTESKGRFAPKNMNGKKGRGSRRRAAATEGPTHFEILKDFIGTLKGGPKDLARNHTFYAHGGKKR